MKSKVRFFQTGVLAAALLLVGGGCVSQTDPSGTSGQDVSDTEVSEDVMMDDAEGESPEEEGSGTETFTHASGTYTFTYDPAEYETEGTVNTSSVSLNTLSGKTGLQVFIRTAGDSSLSEEVQANATSTTPTFAKNYGTMKIYAALSSDGQILEIRCQSSSCDEVLPMLTVN